MFQVGIEMQLAIVMIRLKRGLGIHEFEVCILFFSPTYLFILFFN